MSTFATSVHVIILLGRKQPPHHSDHPSYIIKANLCFSLILFRPARSLSAISDAVRENKKTGGEEAKWRCYQYCVDWNERKKKLSTSTNASLYAFPLFFVMNNKHLISRICGGGRKKREREISWAAEPLRPEVVSQDEWARHTRRGHEQGG